MSSGGKRPTVTGDEMTMASSANSSVPSSPLTAHSSTPKLTVLQLSTMLPSGKSPCQTPTSTIEIAGEQSPNTANRPAYQYPSPDGYALLSGVPESAARSGKGPAGGDVSYFDVLPSSSPTLGRSKIPGITQDTKELKNALLHFIVIFLGFSILFVLYLNVILLRPYLSPLFWAATLSVPLHSLKSSLLVAVRRGLENRRCSIVKGLFLPLRFFVRLLLGRRATKSLAKGLHQYCELVSKISNRRKRSSSVRVDPVNPSYSSIYSSGSDMSSPETSPQLSSSRKHTIADRREQFASVTKSDSELTSIDSVKARAEGHMYENDSTSEPSPAILCRKRTLGRTLVGDSAGDVGSISEDLARLYSENDRFQVWLYRACVLRITWLIIPHETLLVGLSVLIGLMALHLLCHILYRLLAKLFAFDKAVEFTFGNVRRAHWSGIGSATMRISQIISGLIRRFLLAHLNSFLSLVIVVATTSTVSMLTGYLVFKVGEETRDLLNSVIEVVNDPTNGQHIDPSQRDRFNTLILNFKERAVSLLDSELHRRGFNTSAAVIFQQLQEAYFGVVRGSAEVEASTASQLKQHWFLRYLPTTSRLLKSLVAGNLSAFDVDSLSTARVEVQGMLEYKGNLDFVAGIGVLASEAKDALGLNLLSVLNLALVGYSYVFSFILFMITLFTLVSNEYGVVHHVSRVWTFIDPNQQIRSAFEETLNAVWLCTVKLTSFHVLFTWLTFSLAGVRYVYISVLATAVLALIPMVNVSLIAAPAAYDLWTRKDGSLLYAGLLIISHLFANFSVDSQIYETIPDAHPYYSSLAIFLGWSAFGLEGLILGPLLMAFVPLTYKRFGEFLRYLELTNVPSPGTDVPARHPEIEAATKGPMRTMGRTSQRSWSNSLSPARYSVPTSLNRRRSFKAYASENSDFLGSSNFRFRDTVTGGQ